VSALFLFCECGGGDDYDHDDDDEKGKEEEEKQQVLQHGPTGSTKDASLSATIKMQKNDLSTSDGLGATIPAR
jgi:hypothetical protein